MRRGRHTAMIAGMLAVVTAGVFWLTRRSKDIEPAGPNPFVGEYELKRVEGGEGHVLMAGRPAPGGQFVRPETAHSVASDISLDPAEGFYATITLTLQSQLPSTYEDRPVQPPARWPADIRIYPRHGTPDDAEAVSLRCVPAKENVAKERGAGPALLMPILGTTGYWQRPGFKGPLVLADEAAGDRICFWTYFAFAGAPGEYIYEVRLFPTCAFVSTIRYELGEPVILHRGLLRIAASRL